MNKKKHSTITVLVGAIVLLSLIVNLIQILTQNPEYFTDMFKSMKEVGLPWIPYLSITTIICSAVGATGLLRNRQWGFYGIYLAYLTAISVAWFPFFPAFLLHFTSGIINSVVTFGLLVGLLGFLVYLHFYGRRKLYFEKSTAI